MFFASASKSRLGWSFLGMRGKLSSVLSRSLAMVAAPATQPVEEIQDGCVGA